jgi:hypothetical protein
MADDESDRVKPWTIKGIPPEIRNAAIAAADREKLAIGAWLGRAILGQVKADRSQDRAPVLVGLTVAPEADLADIERLIAATAELAQAAGEPPPKGVTRAAYALLRDKLTAIKGPTGKKKSPTEAPQGPTEDADGLTSEVSR